MKPGPGNDAADARGEPGLPPRAAPPAARVLFILCGSIAAYKACDAISQLVQRGHRVRVVVTAAALRFVGVATLEGLTGEKVATDLWAEGEALEHIALTRWADLVLVCPATANTLNRLAAGLADDLAGAVLLAHDWKKPLLVAPAMNPAMWSHPATVAALARLQGWGAQVIPVAAGRTACGEVGEGRLAEPDDIVVAVEGALARPARPLRVLITSGGTVEPIDGVRVIANSSTGATGALIARCLARQGHQPRLLRARNAVAVPGVPEDLFTTFAELDAALARLLQAEPFDAVVHAAAVSDFSLAAIIVDGVTLAPGAGKLPSGSAPTLQLRPNPKLLDSLRQRSRNPHVRIVGFKLTRGAGEAEVRAAVAPLFGAAGADFVVHNDVARRGAEPDDFPAGIWSRGATGPEHCAGRRSLAEALERLLVTACAPTAVGTRG
jgi:phosphopantothenoylcysteine decarboxylase / phosphopantothenate---cysteine ligase